MGESPSPVGPVRSVLGIDAAWTNHHPSGVALAVQTAGGWHLAAVEASYAEFHARAERLPTPEGKPAGSVPVAAELLDSAEALCGQATNLVAIDMPLSRTPFTGRRASDNAVSRAYGGRHCATHSPSSLRPGSISDCLRAGFEVKGYPLRTVDGASVGPSVLLPALIEVYPHPALVEFAGASKRLPYKVANIRKYWPEHESWQRIEALRTEWLGIVELLDRQLAGVADALPLPPLGTKGWTLKAYEDKLDAVVCACIGICAVEGRALAFGDDASAIWIPIPAGSGGVGSCSG